MINEQVANMVTLEKAIPMIAAGVVAIIVAEALSR